MRRHIRLVFIAAGVMVSVAGAALLAHGGDPLSGSGPSVPSPHSVARDHGVAALGRIEPQSEMIKLGGAATDVLADLTVQRGSVVTRGQIIGHFRGFDEACAREQAVARQLSEARAQLAAEKELGEARTRAAQAQLDGILAIGPARIETQTAAIRSLEIDLANNVDILNGRMALRQSEVASRRTLDDQRALVNRQRSDLVAARSRLEELRRQFDLDRSNAEAALAVERATTLRNQAQIPVASFEQMLALAHAQAAAASLIAPIDGTVLNVNVHAGEAVGSGPIVSLGNLAIMHAVAEVYETDVPRVRLGQRATVTSPALARPLTGRVFEIGRMIFKNDVLNVDPAAKTDARVVEVRIVLDDASAVAGLSNLTVDVVIASDGGIAEAETTKPAR
jgi:HlyD family secretion protein